MTGFDFRKAVSTDNDVHDPHNTAGFVLDDDDKPTLAVEHTPQKFPMLVRRSTGTQLQSDGPAYPALTSPDTDRQLGGWPTATHTPNHRARQSMPLNTISNRSSVHTDTYDMSQLTSMMETPTKTAAKTRHSMEVNFGSQPFDSKRSSLLTSPSNGFSNGPPKLTSSFSTNDIPTLGGVNGLVTPSKPAQSGLPKTHAEQHLHNHNASIGRVPPNVVNRHSRDASTDLRPDETPKNFARPMTSVLQANAAPFGPTNGSMAPTNDTGYQSPQSNGATSPTSGAYYGGYGMPMLNNAFAGFNLGSSQGQWAAQIPPAMYQAPGLDMYHRAVNTYGTNRINDSQARVIAQRRQQQNEGELTPDLGSSFGSDTC